MDQALKQIFALQGYMNGEISSLKGIIYFLMWFFATLFISSFGRFREQRVKCLLIIFCDGAI